MKSILISFVFGFLLTEAQVLAQDPPLSFPSDSELKSILTTEIPPSPDYNRKPWRTLQKLALQKDRRAQFFLFDLAVNHSSWLKDRLFRNYLDRSVGSSFTADALVLDFRGLLLMGETAPLNALIWLTARISEPGNISIFDVLVRAGLSLTFIFTPTIQLDLSLQSGTQTWTLNQTNKFQKRVEPMQLTSLIDFLVASLNFLAPTGPEPDLAHILSEAIYIDFVMRISPKPHPQLEARKSQLIQLGTQALNSADPSEKLFQKAMYVEFVRLWPFREQTEYRSWLLKLKSLWIDGRYELWIDQKLQSCMRDFI